MKAFVIGPVAAGANRAAWVPASLPDPTPKPGEVLVRVRAAALNFRDLLVTRQQYGAESKRNLVPLADGAGEIAALGAGVERVQVGDRVVLGFNPEWRGGPLYPSSLANVKGAGSSDGTLAELVTIGAAAVAKIPDALSFEAAATLPCAGVTAYNALFVSGPRLEVGQTVLVQGTGGVSVFAAQLALGAGLRVIATSSSAAKLERMRALGVHGLIDYKQTPDWSAEARRLTDGAGVDHVIEVGGSGTLAQSLQAAKLGGTISLIGLLTGLGAQIDPMPILMRGLRVQGILVGSTDMLDALVRVVTATRLEPVIDEVIPFDRAPEALAKLEAGRHFGKLVIRVGA